MFCPKCGGAINDGVRFCSYCGFEIKPLVEEPVADTQPSVCEQRNDVVVEQMDRLLQYFSVKKSAYMEYDNIVKTIYRMKNGCSKAALIWGIILGALTLGLSTLFVWLGEYYVERLYIILFLALLSGGLFVLHFVGIRMCWKNRLATAVYRYHQLSYELYQHYCGFENCPINPQYTNPSNLFAIRQHIASGREQTINSGVMVAVMETQRTRAVDYAGYVFNYIQQSPWRADPAFGEIPPFCLSDYLK